MLDTSTAPAAPGETPAGGPTRRARPARTLPSFPGGALPAREGRGRTAYIRVVAVLALVVSTAYLAWRTFATVDLAVWWVDPGDMRTRMQEDAFPGEDLSDRADPHDVARALVALIQRRPPSGRIRVPDLEAVGNR